MQTIAPGMLWTILCTDEGVTPQGHGSCLCNQAARRASLELELGLDGIHDRAQVILDGRGLVGVLAAHAINLPRVVRHLGVGKLEAVCSGHNDSAVCGGDSPALAQLEECGQRHTGVRAVEHACKQGSGC